MSIETKVIAAVVLTAVSTLTTTVATAAVAFDGRFYEFVPASGVTWAQANAAANGRLPINGLTAHLATIATPAEDAFLSAQRVGNVPTSGNQQVWVGGFQPNCNPQPGCGWTWVNGESFAAGTTNYTNWQTNPQQPDNLPQPSANHVTIGTNRQDGWADYDKTNDIWGYVVEWGDNKTVPLTSCLSSAPGQGCNLSFGSAPGLQMKLPSTAQQTGGDSVNVRVWQVEDAPGRCSVAHETREFDLLDDADHPGVDFVMPAWLCADSGSFVIVKTTTPVDIPNGVVSFINNPANQGLNLPYICQSPIPANGNVLLQDIVVHQLDDDAKTFEGRHTTNIDPAWNGATFGEFTTGCINPSRSTGPKGTWFAVGVRLYPRDGVSAQQFLIDLFKLKAEVLLDVVAEAGAKGAVKSGDATKLTSSLNQILAEFANFKWQEASSHLKNAQKFAKPGIFKNVRYPQDGSPGAGTFINYEGEIETRLNNLVFMLDVKLIPFQ